MMRRNTQVILVIFLLLTAAAYYLQKNPIESGKDEATPRPEAVQVTNFPKADIRLLTVENAEGEKVVISQDPESGWMLEEPETAVERVDAAAINNAAKSLARWKELASIDMISDFKLVGLKQPAFTITVELEGGDTVVITVGDMNVTSTGFYVRVGERSPQLVASQDVLAVTNLIAMPPVLPEPTPEETATPEITAAPEATEEPTSESSAEPGEEATEESTGEPTAPTETPTPGS